MKKILLIALALILALSVLAGCSAPEAPEAPAAPAAPTEPAAAEGSIVKVGLGHITSIGKSADLGKDAEGKEILPLGQVDTVMAAAGFDKDGKVVSVTIDNAQTKVTFDSALQVTSDIKAEGKTKVELKEEYGMIKGSAIGKEWYQQAEALGQWMVGKTIDEIKAMKTKEKDASHPAVPDVPELTSSVTVSVQDYIAAVAEAYETAIDVTGGVKVGLGHVVTTGKSTGLGKNAEGKEVLPLAQVDTVMSATAFDKDGKVVGTIIDNAQTKVTFDNTGKVTADKAAEYKTKVELKEEYGMIKGSAIGKEWYQQADALGKWMVGKSIDEIKAMKTKAKDEAHPAVPDVAELTSLVTVSVQDYVAAVAEAFANAK
jgi:roadblock/LC7 domain-containing protein